MAMILSPDSLPELEKYGSDALDINMGRPFKSDQRMTSFFASSEFFGMSNPKLFSVGRFMVWYREWSTSV